MVETVARWMRAQKYCELTGDPMYSIQERIRDGVWAAGIHYRRIGQRVLWINYDQAMRWVEMQPHIEVSFRKVSRSGTESAETASG